MSILGMTRKREGLVQKSYKNTATNNATTTGTINVPRDRGDIIGVSFHVGTETVADLANLKLSLTANGISIIEDASGLQHSSLYRGDDNIYRVLIPAATELEFEFINDSANSIPVFIDLFFHQVDKDRG